VPFVRHWIHCGWLEIGGEKMSKRAGTLYTIPELLEKGYTGADLRVYLLRTHYRSPLPFDLPLIDEAAKTRAKLDHFVHYEMAERAEGVDKPEVAQAIETARRDFAAALEDDLNTSVALAAIHTFMTAVNRAEPSCADAARAITAMREFDAIFGVLSDAPARGSDDAEIDALVAERDAARASKNWARADQLRNDLAARGIELLDSASGTRWRRK
jgi:cysteinyl-tRNA synthetase